MRSGKDKITIWKQTTTQVPKIVFKTRRGNGSDPQLNESFSPKGLLFLMIPVLVIYRPGLLRNQCLAIPNLISEDCICGGGMCSFCFFTSACKVIYFANSRATRERKLSGIN
ncbi:hypothetical protein CEXT_672981 [Caerostris extrusa]|uniref:Uncharacterized protein n=1 Tax=Caerostris extrusa TaxID=172846 RepID=A0AAV4T0Z1_CAEEX|nr:hypothetical protein CEXT_672981 [Caerostris extrusa]